MECVSKRQGHYVQSQQSAIAYHGPIAVFLIMPLFEAIMSCFYHYWQREMDSGEQSYASDNTDRKCKSSVEQNTAFKTMTRHHRQRFDTDAVLVVYIFLLSVYRWCCDIVSHTVCMISVNDSLQSISTSEIFFKIGIFCAIILEAVHWPMIRRTKQWSSIWMCHTWTCLIVLQYPRM